ncbi:hypothetical protein FHS27_003777 [Rhodopirellula rubra]|uniref:ECF transporter S component n=1 Tax=Aporhodopirellula rubra TaxID=980271 RepID=A0A7W5E0L5_9BACT|nr:DUF6580 family putative transport protein [Aporhodopirellula rubra]MBB3207950.1 hypothetical protein [Aporhodopirellula rubra]
MNTITTRIRRSLSTISTSQVAMIGAAMAVAVAARLLPHPPNFTPMAAIGLFAGAVCLRPVVAASAIVGAMLISDLFLGFHTLMPIVYGCLLVNLVIGARFVRGANGLQFGAASCGRIIAGSLIGSVLFFLVTNFAHFLAFYPPTMGGLAACYTAAIPFFQFTVSGDLAYTGVMFGSLALISIKSGSFVGTRTFATQSFNAR